MTEIDPRYGKEIDPRYGKDGEIGRHLSEEDQQALRIWREHNTILDPRYHEIALLALVARAISDGEFRDRLVNDTDALLDECDMTPPEGMEVRFFDNTPTTVNVVLPPVAGEIEARSGALRDSLKSRTEEALPWFNDDWNWYNRHTRDNLFPTPVPPWPARVEKLSS